MVKAVYILRSNPVDPDPRVEKIAKTLTEHYPVKILAWSRDKDREPGSVGTAGITYFNRLAPYGSGIRNLWNLLGWQAWLLRLLWNERRHIIAIHACDFDTFLPALFLTLITRTPIVYDIFDYYAAHIRNTPKPIKALISSLERFLLKFADKVILPDEVRIDQIGKIPEDKLEIVYNTPEDAFAGEIAFKPPFTITYIGILQKERAIFELANIAKKHPEIQFDVAGYGGDEEAFIQHIDGYANIRWLGRVSYTEALKTYARSDLILALYDPAVENHAYASPNKIFEAMMLSRPLLVAEHTNIDTIVHDNNLGLVVNYNNTAEIEEAIKRFVNQPEFGKLCGRNGRKLYESRFNWALMQERLQKIYQDIFAK